jgi:hypothetical protein
MPTPIAGLCKTLRGVNAHDDGIVLVPFGFVINGTSDPDGVIGDLFRTVVRTAAGKFTCTLKARPARCFSGHAEVSSTADSTDITGKVDWSSVKSAGTFVVRTMTGSVQTDPADNTIVGGFLVVARTSRDGRRAP